MEKLAKYPGKLMEKSWKVLLIVCQKPWYGRLLFLSLLLNNLP